MIFRCISLFLSFGFAYFHLFYIYLTLPYPHKKKKKRDSFPPSSGTTATSLQLCFHCDCILHLVLWLLAIDIRPIITFSIAFLPHHIASLHITLHRASHIIASHIETVYRKGLSRPCTFLY